MYGNEDSSVPATYQVLYFIGWKPDSSQVSLTQFLCYLHLNTVMMIDDFLNFCCCIEKPEPSPRGSGQVSLKDLSEVIKADPKDNKKPQK